MSEGKIPKVIGNWWTEKAKGAICMFISQNVTFHTTKVEEIKEVQKNLARLVHDNCPFDRGKPEWYAGDRGSRWSASGSLC